MWGQPPFVVSDTEARLGDPIFVTTPEIAPRRRFAWLRYWYRYLRLRLRWR
jgi:hypothetical protein